LPSSIFRHVENVVDDCQQVLAADVNIFGIFPVLDRVYRPEALALHEIGEVDDGIQGRAQLVAHDREKPGLAAVGALGSVARLLGLAVPPRRAHEVELQQRQGGGDAGIAPGCRDDEAAQKRRGILGRDQALERLDLHAAFDDERRGVHQGGDRLLRVERPAVIVREAHGEVVPIHQAYGLGVFDHGYCDQVRVAPKP
jgi:hypothetical protein